MAKNVLTHNLSEPLGGAKTAKIDLYVGTGNLIIDQLTGNGQMLATGTLEYLESQGLPTRSVDTSNGQATLTLNARGAIKSGFRFPWAACNAATEWNIHLNPHVHSDINARSGGGNVRLNLAGMAVTRLSADTGGGNMDVVLPEGAADLNVVAKTGGGNVAVEIGKRTSGHNIVEAGSGAGNVAVHLPGGIAARIYATSGMGKVFVDPAFSMIDKNTYQSPDFESAPDRVEITAKSGAGNVTINTK